MKTVGFWEDDFPAEFCDGDGGLYGGGGFSGLGDFWRPIADLTLPATIILGVDYGSQVGYFGVVFVWGLNVCTVMVEERFDGGRNGV